MSKNMTRKGLALGATLALATTGLVATPAFANSVVTSLASGTSFNSVVGYDNELRLSTVMSPGLASNETTLHYRVKNPTGAALEIGVGNTASAVVLVTVATGSPLAPTADTGGVWGYENASAAYSTVDADSVRAGFQTSLTDFVIVPIGAKDGEADDENFITIGAQDATAVADVSVTVQAWLDTAANASNVQDSVEVSGNTVTLNFYDPANVKATTTMVAPVTGASSVSAETVTTPELNGQQLGANFIDVDFTAQGNSNAVLAENTSSDAAVSPTVGGTTYNGTTKKWTSVAYLAYSKATDAWRGSNGTINGIADLLAVNGASDEATVAVANAAAETVTMAVFPHGLPESFTAGTFVATFDDLDSSAAVASNSDFVAKPLTYVSANSVTWAPTGATELGYTTINTAAEDVTGGAVTFWSVAANSTVQASGVYSARPYIGSTALGVVGSSTNVGVTASNTKAYVAVSENVQAGYDDDGSAASTVKVRTGTATVTATATIYYVDALDFNKVKVAGAGVPVTGTLSTATGTFQINSAGAGVTTSTVLTDAKGQVSFTVSTTTSSSTSNVVTLSIAPQSRATNAAESAAFTFDWDDAAYTLYDTNSTVKQPTSNASSYRFINAGGVLNFNFALLDQWGKAAPDASWRLNLINSGRTVSSDTHALSNGRVSVNVADGAQGSGSTITTTVNVQKLVAGTWTTQAAESWDGTDFGTVVTNVAAASDDTITLDADAAQLYASSYISATNADLSSPIAADDVVAQDRRISAVAQPGYSDDVVVNGRVTNKLTGVAKGGTRVTITGDSSILFSSGDVDAFGSITVMADADGNFTFRAYSNKAQKDSVITITTANAGSKTQKITFEAVGPRTGENLTITATAAEPGKTLIVTGLLTDYYGNPVDTDQTDTNAAGASTLDAGDARLTVTYTGPGLISGTLPVETGADGTFTVRVLLGSNDSGTATVSATYGGANGTISAADTYPNIDVKSALTVTIGKSASTSGKVNVGSFNGKLVVYASGLNGKRISWKVGGNWGSAVASSNYAIFNRPTPRAGVTLNVEVFVDGVSTLKKSVVTR